MLANIKTKLAPALIGLALVPIIAIACGGDSPPTTTPPAPMPEPPTMPMSESTPMPMPASSVETARLVIGSAIGGSAIANCGDNCNREIAWDTIIAATADTGYTFRGWSCAGSCPHGNATQNPEIVLLIEENTTITPIFREDTTVALVNDNARIAFSFVNNIYTINADGSDIKQLADEDGERHHAWSPDGTLVAFSRDGIIRIMNASDGDVRQLTSVAGFGPVWSPDGTKIAFTERTSSSNIYTINADGSDIRQLTNRGGESPSWSPDGTRIAFSRGNSNRGIYTMNALDGSGIRRLTDEDTFSTYPSWSPDGTKIAFLVPRERFFMGQQVRHFSIYTVNTNGSDVKELYTITVRQSDELGDIVTDHPNYTWSPNGRSIAFASVNDRLTNYEIFIINADGSNLRSITNYRFDSQQYTWSPDGTRIAFISRHSYAPTGIIGFIGIQTINIDGTDKKEIFALDQITNLTWLPPTGN